MQNIKRIFSDFLGLCRICGVIVGLRWLLSIATHSRDILHRKNLQPADEAMGNGPFSVNMQNASFRITGAHSISGIREMYVRDTYLRNGTLRISDGDTVVDLGANMGNFTNMALAHGSHVRVLAIEPSAAMNSAFQKSITLNNGFQERATLLRAFIGLKGAKQVDIINNDEQYAGAPWITEDELIQKWKLTKVDFLKCDIEGGEFGLLTKDSKLLAMTTSLAIEIHAFSGNVAEFIENLKSCGFSILAVKWDSDGTCTALAKRE